VSKGSQITLDRLLLAKCQAGDQDAWKVLKEAIWTRIVPMLARCLKGNHELAEEIASRTLIALHEFEAFRLKRHDPNRGALLTYLFAIARRELGKELRKRTVRREVPLHACPPDKLTVSPFNLDLELKELARSLSPQLKSHLQNRCLANPKQRGAPGISGAYARQLDHRIRKKIRTGPAVIRHRPRKRSR
jgi:DNA-directed RNA polymerase specialized sigma24 family protein